MLSPIAQTSLHQNLHAESVVCDIRERVLGGLRHFKDQAWRGILVITGEVIVKRPELRDMVLDHPALVWLPLRGKVEIVGRAGAAFYHMLGTDLVLADAIGHKPESTELRELVKRVVILNLADAPQDLARLTACFSAIVEETAEAAPGTEIVAEAHIRLLLILIWRRSLRDINVAHPKTRYPSVLPVLRQLIETHFRERWTIQRYASQLNVTPDRLHDLCSKALNRSPRVLVQERLMYEAQLLLERSNRSIDDVAHTLGFKTAAHFNRAFSKAMGTPPARFRKQVRTNDQTPAPSRSFADWP